MHLSSALLSYHEREAVRAPEEDYDADRGRDLRLGAHRHADQVAHRVDHIGQAPQRAVELCRGL